MRVLLSIKPEFVSRIFDGSKKYEYRRAIFKQRAVEIIVVYASDPIKRVVGEFEIGEILHEEPNELWTKTCNHAGISKKRFMEYFLDRPKGYAIGIKQTRKYDTPLALNEFMITWPPQSFRYLTTHPNEYPDNTTEVISA